MDCIGETKEAIFVAVDFLRVAEINCVLSIGFSDNDNLDLGSCQLLIGWISVFPISPYPQFSTIATCPINANCIIVSKTD